MTSIKTDSDLTKAEMKLVEDLTGMASSQISLNDLGWTSRVYVANDGQFIMKFPRKEAVKKEYAQEAKIYKLLEPLDLEVQVPKLRWVHPAYDYIGYEGITGVEYDSVAETIDQAHQTAIGHSIGNFLKQLHQLQLDNPHIMTVEDEIKQFQAKYTACLPLLNSRITKDEQERYEKFIYHEMPAEIRRLGSKPVLCHGDLGYWNLVLKQDGQVGVIDFGDVGYYDESKDFGGLEDEAMLEAALEVYGDGDMLRERIAIRRKSIPFLELQYYDEIGDTVKIQETLQTIRERLG